MSTYCGSHRNHLFYFLSPNLCLSLICFFSHRGIFHLPISLSSLSFLTRESEAVAGGAVRAAIALGGRAVPECLPSSSPGRHESRGRMVGELRPVRIGWQGGSSAPVGANRRAARLAASPVCCEGRGRDEPRGGAVLSPRRWRHYNLRRAGCVIRINRVYEADDDRLWDAKHGSIVWDLVEGVRDLTVRLTTIQVHVHGRE
uniref:Uncharacterized protein n=1 Tax=Oryza meridionalis TaxID=40149 RepID=A0A0E0E2A2_9ORYZ